MLFRSVAFLALATQATAQAPERDYTVLVASEAVDRITRLTFGPSAGPTFVPGQTRGHHSLSKGHPVAC